MSTSEGHGRRRKSSIDASAITESKSVKFLESPTLADDVDVTVTTVRKHDKKEHKHKKKKKHHILVDEKDKIIEETFEEIGESDLMLSYGDDNNLTNSNNEYENNDSEINENEVKTTSRHKKSSKVKFKEDTLSLENDLESKSESSPSKIEGKIDEEEIEMLKNKLRAKREKKAKKHKKKASQSEGSFSFISGIEISSNSSTNDASPFPIDDDEINSDDDDDVINDVINDVNDNSNDTQKSSDSSNNSNNNNKKKKKKKKKKKSSEDRYFSKAFMSEFIDEDEVNDSDDDDSDSDNDDDNSDENDSDDNYCDRVPSDDEDGGESADVDTSYDEAGICDLPPGWEPRFDYKSKRWYYVDHNTRTTHWKRPSTSKVDIPLDPDIYPDPKEVAEMFLKSGPPKGKKGVLKAPPSNLGLEVYVSTKSLKHSDLRKEAAKNAKSLAGTEDSNAMSLTNYANQIIQDGSYFTNNATYSKEVGLLYKDILVSLRSTTQVAYETFEYDPTFGISLTRDEQELRMFYTVYTRRVARPSFDDDLFIKDYAPEAFDHLRKCLRISQESYMHSWSRSIVPPTDPKTLTDIMILSSDKKYALRAIDHSAAKMIFKNFYTFLQHFQSNPSSILAKIIGLYRIPNVYPSLGFLSGIKHMYFIAVINPVAYSYNFDEVYDIKPYKTLTSKNDFVSGDTFKLLVENRASYVQYDSTKAKLSISEKDRKHLIKQVEHDVNFLADLKLMGYCCVISIHYTDLCTQPPQSSSLSSSSASYADSITIDDGEDYLETPSLGTDSMDPIHSPESTELMTPEVVNIADRTDPFENPNKIRKSKVKVKRASSVTPVASPRTNTRAQITPMEPVSLDIANMRRPSRSTEVLVSPRHLNKPSKKSISPGGLPISPLKNSKPHSRLSEGCYFSESPENSDSESGVSSPTPSRRYKDSMDDSYSNDDSLSNDQSCSSYDSNSHDSDYGGRGRHSGHGNRAMSPIAEPPVTLAAAVTISPTSSSNTLISPHKETSHKRLPSPTRPSDTKPFIPKIPIPSSSLMSSSSSGISSSPSDKYVVKSPRTYKRGQSLGADPKSLSKKDHTSSMSKLAIPPIQVSPRGEKSPGPSARRTTRSVSASPRGVIRTPRSIKGPQVIPVTKKCKYFNILYLFNNNFENIYVLILLFL